MWLDAHIADRACLVYLAAHADLARVCSMQVSELLPAEDFFVAEKYHQQYLQKGGRFGQPQNASKGATDKIRCYG